MMLYCCTVGVRSYVKESIMCLLEVHAEVGRHLVSTY